MDRHPADALLDLIVGKWVAQAIHVVAKLGIADLLADGPKDCDELARANQMDEGSLYRVLRATASVGVFEEVADRRFALTPMAEYLRRGVPGSLRGFATMAGEDWTWRPWGDIVRSVKTGEPAFDRVFGTGPFEYLAANPGAATIFDEAMTGLSSRQAAAIVEAYPFGRFGTIVDVGGGQGALLGAILEANPGVRGILFDAPAVIEGALDRIEAAGLAGRLEGVAGSFFDAVPEGGDAYLFKNVIHDWDDPRAVAILANCRRAMGPSATLLLVETVIPAGNAPAFGKLLDLEMLVMAGGRERTETEYRNLLALAGFRLDHVVPSSSPLGLIEATPTP